MRKWKSYLTFDVTLLAGIVQTSGVALKPVSQALRLSRALDHEPVPAKHVRELLDCRNRSPENSPAAHCSLRFTSYLVPLVAHIEAFPPRCCS